MLFAMKKNCKTCTNEDLFRYKNLYENFPLPYQSLDENGNFVEVNPAWEKMIGYSRKEVIGRNFSELIDEKYSLLFQKNFPKFKEKGKTEVEFEMLTKAKEVIFVNMIGQIAYDKEGNFRQTHCVVTNITKRKKVEEDLQMRNEELETFNKMAMDREIKMVELKNKIAELEEKLAKS